MTGDDRLLWGVASTAVLVGVWWLGSLAFPATIPGVIATGGALVAIVTQPGPYDQPFYFHVYKTAEMILLSVAASLVLGTLVGVTIGSRSALSRTLGTWIYAWLAVPSLVIVFLSAIWLGFNAGAGFFAVPAVITPFVALNMWEGTRNLDEDLAEMAEFFGASRRQTFEGVILPQLIPYLFASVRSALSIGWKITLLAEAFLLTRGVGFMFKWYFDQFSLPRMLGWIIIFVVFLVVIEYGVVLPVRNRFTHWRPEASGIRATE